MMPLLLLVACADYSLSKGDAAAYETADTAAADTAVDEGDTAEVVVPDHWTPRGRLSIVDGAAVPDGAELFVDTVRVSDGAVVCAAPYDTGLLIAATPPDPSLYQWWSGAVAAPDGCEGAPGTLSVGIGPLLPDLRARLGALGLEAAADALYGAYVSTGGTTVWAFGAAGTEAAYAGEGVADSPPDDGAYVMVPLYAVALGG
jgi:hypothetical protein